MPNPQKIQCKRGEKAQGVNVLSTQPGNISLMPRTHTMEG